MDTFYDGDLKDIWDSDLDPSESLKLSNEADLPIWFLDRDEKHSTVILNDKLISDPLLNSTLPIKSEHSYSLNSDGDSLSNSPRSLPKIDDLEDECYPAISLKTATSNVRGTIDPKFINLNYFPPIVAPIPETCYVQNKLSVKIPLSPSDAKMGAFNFRDIEENAMSHVKSAEGNSYSSDNLSKQMLPSPTKRERGESTDICSDIEIEECCVKDEPMSPDTSCPPSPLSKSSTSPQNFSINVRLTNVTSNTDIVLEHEISSPSASLISSHLDNNLPKSQDSNMMLSQIESDAESSTIISNKSFKKHTRNSLYNVPLTPPSSLSSEDSQGDLTPECFVSPHLSNNPITTAATKPSSSTFIATNPGNMHERRSQNLSTINALSPNFSRSLGGNCTRQPIHTPLISCQPKGSTGLLVLTDEEKRTLQAEGYPIPQKLPLTKAEEKSLKKIRRKIKNKISAQESRRKKKEYMDQLERRVETLANENNKYKKRVNTLEDAYANLLSQLQRLQAVVDKHNLRKT